MPLTPKSLALSAATAIATLAVAASPAAAHPDHAPTMSDTSQAGCELNAPVVEQPFGAFGDFRNYVLAPGASFESPADSGWAFTGGAMIVEGNEPFQVHGEADHMSLRIPGGATAVSPFMCVDATYDTMRVFVRSLNRNQGGKLSVTAQYPDLADADELRTDISKPGPDWSLTDDIAIRPGEKDTGKSGFDNGFTRVAFVFKAKGIGKAGYHIDDLYVDPKSNR